MTGIKRCLHEATPSQHVRLCLVNSGRFRNAVDRAIKQIAKYDKPLAEHLDNSIKRGDVVGYRPESPITWDVRPIVNG